MDGRREVARAPQQAGVRRYRASHECLTTFGASLHSAGMQETTAEPERDCSVDWKNKITMYLESSRSSLNTGLHITWEKATPTTQDPYQPPAF